MLRQAAQLKGKLVQIQHGPAAVRGRFFKRSTLSQITRRYSTHQTLREIEGVWAEQSLCPSTRAVEGFFNAQNIYYKKLDIALKNIVLEIQGAIRDRPYTTQLPVRFWKFFNSTYVAGKKEKNQHDY